MNQSRSYCCVVDKQSNEEVPSAFRRGVPGEPTDGANREEPGTCHPGNSDCHWGGEFLAEQQPNR